MTSQGGSAMASAVGNNNPEPPSMSEGCLDPCSWPPSSSWMGNEAAPFASKTSPEHMPWEPPRPSSWEWENSVLLPPSRADWGVASRKSPNADGTRHIQDENKCGAFPFSLRSASQGLEDVVSAGGFAGHSQRRFFLTEEQRIQESEAKGKTEEQEDSSPSSGQQEMGKEAWSNSNASELKIRPPTCASNMTDQEGGAAGTTGAASADALIGLKLGKRTYFEDSAVSKAASTHVSSLPSGKKPRPLAQTIQVPRCQVEGCKADLSDAKGYHRRHKVCEMHSKTPKNMVAGKEQRFCQQCSRFHVLTEFDEGKRSCRRRLEGHNQRRRKPPQEAFPGVGSCSLFSEDQRGAHVLGDGSCFIPTHRGNSPSLLEDLANSIRYANENWSRYYRFSDQSSLSSATQTPGEERQLLHSAPLSGEAVDRLQMLLQAKRDPGPLSASVANQGVHQFLKGSSIGQGLALSSSSSETGVLVGLSPHGLAGIANSEGALSLLSFEPWTSRSCNSAPLEISASANAGIGQMINESAQRFVDEGSASGSRKLTSHSQPQSALNISTSLSSSINVSTAQEQHLPTTLRMIDQHHHQENRYMLNLMHGQMQPPNARTMMDLVHQKTVSSALQPASGRFG